MKGEGDNVWRFDVHEGDTGVRLDVFLASRPISMTRSRVQALVKSRRITVNHRAAAKSSTRLKPGDHVCVTVPPVSDPLPEPESVPFSVIYEDPFLLVLDKPPGVVVHPAPGHFRGTLVHGILKHCTDLSGIGGVARPGIVHRLDKNTSGLMVVAKSDPIHVSLAAQFKAGEVKKEYLALVHGRVSPATGYIDLPIGRHPVRRKEMAVRPSGGKNALTLWTTRRHYRCGLSLLCVTIRTGRTHQIRVHLSHLGHPVVGDPVYGPGKNRWRRFPPFQEGLLPDVHRQMLHAGRLGFKHPHHDSDMEFEAPLPEDMKTLLDRLDLWESDEENSTGD